MVHCDDLRLDSQNCKVYPRGSVVAKEVAIEWSRLIKRNKKTQHRANLQWKPPPPTLPSAKVYTSSLERQKLKSDVYMRQLMEEYGQGDVTFGPANRFWKGNCLNATFLFALYLRVRYYNQTKKHRNGVTARKTMNLLKSTIFQ